MIAALQCIEATSNFGSRSTPRKPMIIAPQDYDGEASRILDLLHRADPFSEDSPLTGIGLQNFQAITGPAFIPLSRVTLLYGPNSAGKSAVGDALRFLAALRPGQAETVIHGLLQRWASFHRDTKARVSQPHFQSPSSVIFWAAVGPGVNLANDAIDHFGSEYETSHFSGPSDLLANNPFAIRLEYGVGASSHSSLQLISFALWAGTDRGGPLLTVSQREPSAATEHVPSGILTVDVDHPACRFLQHGWTLSSEGGLDQDEHGLFGNASSSSTFVLSNFDWFALTPWTYRTESDSFRNDEEARNFGRLRYLMNYVGATTVAAALAADCRHVPPVRRVPTAAESVFYFGTPLAPEPDPRTHGPS